MSNSVSHSVTYVMNRRQTVQIPDLKLYYDSS